MPFFDPFYGLNNYYGKRKFNQFKDKISFKASTFVKENKGKLKDFYKIGKLIGSGAYGDVRVCLHIESE